MEMLQKILPGAVFEVLPPRETLLELRLRAGFPVIAATVTGNLLLSRKGSVLCLTAEEIRNVLFEACEHSLYAYNDQIAKGYLALDGLRLGICGEAVTDDSGKIVTVKECTSLNVRIERQACGTALATYLAVGRCNLLVLSPPGAGKTTFLRDYLWQLLRHERACNLLVADERNEIALTPMPCDVMKGGQKRFVLQNALRAMNPDVIATDEIRTEDYPYLAEVKAGGVNLVATAHAGDLSTFLQTRLAGLFDVFVMLSKQRRVGEVIGVYDRAGHLLPPAEGQA